MERPAQSPVTKQQCVWCISGSQEDLRSENHCCWLLHRRNTKTYGDQQSCCLPEAFKHLYLVCLLFVFFFFLTKAPNFSPTHTPLPFGPARPKYSSSLTQWVVSHLCCPMFCLPGPGLPDETWAISELTYLETSPECSGQSQPPSSLHCVLPVSSLHKHSGEYLWLQVN